jgi:Uma2 family endonuclease
VRHPDLANYKTSPPEGENEDEFWSQWVPEIVVEIVSVSSRHRDYQEKPEEYLRLGVSESWIVDADEGLMKVLRRSRGRWIERPVHPPSGYRTRLLPGLKFSIEAFFQAASGA